MSIQSDLDSPLVTVNNGYLKGLYLDTFNQDAYLGIPFAQPPLGDLRFANPQPLNATWEGIQEVKGYGPSCLSTGLHSTKLSQSEDCLKLNIVKPRGYENQSSPVAIWIYGGSFMQGASARPGYNLSYIVKIRLSGFGFLRSREVEYKGYTNVGIRDQIQGIEWVHENIEQFGGDPNHLVIWGESAGGYSVGKLLVSQKLGDYIKGGIMESGTSMFADYFSDTLTTTEDDFAILTEYFNCTEAPSSFECLQHADAEELKNVFDEENGILKGGFHATYVDGDIVPKSSFLSIQGGEYQKVPLLLGTNTDEGVDFVPEGLNTTEELKNALAKDFPYLTNTSIDKLNELYPVGDPLVSSPLDPTYNNTPIEYPSSYGARTTAEITALRDEIPVYKYRHNIPNNDTFDTPYIGARHFREIVYVFDNNDEPNDPALGEQFLDDPRVPGLASTISKIWVSFITDLNPNLPAGNVDTEVPNWPEYKVGQKNMVFDINGFYLENDDWRTDQIKFIESIEVEKLK